MLLGIDVGGTFTDAVLIGRGTIIAQAKRRTTHEAVLQGILEALDEVLQEQEVYNIERVVISSTIVTNALTEGRTDPVFLAVMTGPGMNVSKSFPVEPYYVSGYVDHRSIRAYCLRQKTKWRLCPENFRYVILKMNMHLQGN